MAYSNPFSTLMAPTLPMSGQGQQPRPIENTYGVGARAY
jgi:hypothetical protein